MRLLLEVRRRSEHSDLRRHHGADGRGRRQLGRRSDLRRRTQGAARCGEAVLRARHGRQRRQLDGPDGACTAPPTAARTTSSSSWSSKGARLDVKDKEGRTPLTWAEGVFLATHPAKAETELDRADQEVDGASSGGAAMNGGPLPPKDGSYILRELAWLRARPSSRATRRPLPGKPQQPAAPLGPRRTQSLLKQYCVTCHNERAKTAGLVLDALELGRMSAPTPRPGKRSSGRSGPG